MNQKSEKNIWKDSNESEKGNIYKSKISENTSSYKHIFSKVANKKIQKLNKSERLKVINKIENICNNPLKSYKFLRHDMQGSQRVHIGHFVLVFTIDIMNRIVYFEDYDNHDKIYK